MMLGLIRVLMRTAVVHVSCSYLLFLRAFSKLLPSTQLLFFSRRRNSRRLRTSAALRRRWRVGVTGSKNKKNNLWFRVSDWLHNRNKHLELELNGSMTVQQSAAVCVCVCVCVCVWASECVNLQTLSFFPQLKVSEFSILKQQNNISESQTAALSADTEPCLSCLDFIRLL